MRGFEKFGKKALSIFLCLCLLAALLPAVSVPSKAAVAGTATADKETHNDWQQYFLPEDGSLSTERAGGIWTDKSVFTDSTQFPGHGITVEPGNFLVALSAIASNMSVTGSSSVPTDTIFILDVSGSMANSGLGDDLAVAANASIVKLLENPKKPGGRCAVLRQLQKQ